MHKMNNLLNRKHLSHIMTALSLGVLFSLSGLANTVAPAVPAGSGGGGTAAPMAGGGGPAPIAGASGQGGLMGMMFPFILMLGVLYFLMLRPQKKKEQERQKMLTALSHGDEVVTSSGILGKITGIADKVVTLEIADNVRIKVLKSQVGQVIKGQIKDLA